MLQTKRKLGSAVIDRCEISIDIKRDKSEKSKRYPTSFLHKDAFHLDHWVLNSLQMTKEGGAVDRSRMEVDNENHLTFLIFLGAQGKEYIDEIQHMFPPSFDALVFVSLNIDSRFTRDPSMHWSDSETCKELATYFNILDPLGGGVYPLNYLIVTDSDLVVRCKLPIQIGRFYSPHQKFGVSLSELQGLIDEYLEFFMQHHITISF